MDLYICILWIYWPLFSDFVRASSRRIVYIDCPTTDDTHAELFCWKKWSTLNWGVQVLKLRKRWYLHYTFLLKKCLLNLGKLSSALQIARKCSKAKLVSIGFKIVLCIVQRTLILEIQTSEQSTSSAQIHIF